MSLSLLPRQDGDDGQGSLRAILACVACKKQKRKCDKALPICGLCRRMNRLCEYVTEQQPAPTAEDLATLQTRLGELEDKLTQHAALQLQQQQQQLQHLGPERVSGIAGMNQSAKTNSRDPMWLSALSKFPSAAFLDIDCFKWAGLPIPKPPVDIPLEILEILSDSDAIQQATTEYFSTIHIWLPIISKKRMDLGIPFWDGGPDLAMLFLAMKLVTSRPAEGVSAADNPLYPQSKRFLALLETSGTISLLYLQALVLVAIYEYGHAIYPAAWMTVAACARYSDILCLQSYSDSVVMLGQCTTWTEAEERRRVWWGIFVLDRVISLGSKRRFSAAEPEATDPLPVDDTAWDEGRISHAHQRSCAGSPVTEPASPFARLCQVCILITRAVAHCQATQRAHRMVRNGPGQIDVGEVANLTESLAEMCRVIAADMTAAGFADPAPCDGGGPSPGPSSSGGSIGGGGSVDRDHPMGHPEDGNSSSGGGGVGGVGGGGGGGGGVDASPRTQPGAEGAFLRLLAPRCLVWSALIMVLDMYSCPENLRDGPGTALDVVKSPEECALQTQAVEGMNKTCDRIRDYGRELKGLILLSYGGVGGQGSGVGGGSSSSSGHASSTIGRIAPFALDSLYCAVAVFHWLWKETGDAAMESSLVEVHETLDLLAPRWRLAEEYIAMEKHHDVTTVMALRAGR